MKTARVLGGGVAAAVSAHVLSRLGWSVALEAVPASPRHIVLNQRTVATIDRLFDDDALWHDAHRLRRRHVLWGGPPALLPDASLVVDAAALSLRMRAALKRPVGEDVAEGGHGWTIAGRGRAAARARTFGERVMLVAHAELASGSDAEASWTEATPGGWIFVAASPRRALLQAMLPARPADPCGTLRKVISSTRMIAPLLRGEPRNVHVVGAAPALAHELCDAGRIAVGEEAVCVDPVCGDGTGYAVREAILASAVADAVERGLRATTAFEHYRARLETALAAHLRACLGFYAAAPFDASWAAERAACAGGVEALDRAAAARPSFTLGLRDLALLPLV